MTFNNDAYYVHNPLSIGMSVTTMSLLALLLFETASVSAQEYASRKVLTDNPDSVMENQPIDVTKSISIQEYKYQPYTTLYIGDYITGFSFRGYNPGSEKRRHLC